MFVLPNDIKKYFKPGVNAGGFRDVQNPSPLKYQEQINHLTPQMYYNNNNDEIISTPPPLELFSCVRRCFGYKLVVNLITHKTYSSNKKRLY